MQIIKRDGRKEQVKFDKISKRISRLCKDLKNVDNNIVAQKVIQGIYDGITTKELDTLCMEIAYAMSINHPEYDKLASRLAISTLHKETSSSFSEVITTLYNAVDMSGKKRPIIADDVYKIVKKNAHILDSAIDYTRDYLFDYFGYKTLEKSYLLRINEFVDGKLIRKLVERPNHLWLRVSIGIHKGDVDAALKTYEMLSTMQATHATPTLFNSGTVRNQLSSCFLMGMDDSIAGIYDCQKETALISQNSGGIGVHIHNIRAKDSPIYGTGGKSNGIIPMLKVFHETARYVDQGGGKRKGSYAMYLEPWHADVEGFLDLRKNNGKEEMRARDLNLALWTPDLFFKRVEADEEWTLMDPSRCPGLSAVYGDELYTKYEKSNMGNKTIKARELWAKILESCIETGEPYILAKDAGNKKSNQKNIGTICSSNLCAEIFEYSDTDSHSVCNLASISLPSCVDIKKKKFDFDKLSNIVKTLTENLNKVIDVEYYPTEKTKKTNLRDRPIGIGIQGLSNVFLLLRLNFDSEEAAKLNEQIFETMYYSFLKTSCDLSKEDGPYKTFKGSPASKGILQFDLWDQKPSDKYDWDKLKEDIKKHGLRNSLGIALMPTASTSQVLGNVESFEAMTSNIFKRTTLSGDFIQVNKYLVEDLLAINLWNDTIRQKIIANNGSIQNIAEIPDEIKLLYKTVWELSQKTIINMSAGRGKYVCQSQSMNLYFKDINFAKLSSAFMYAWKAGLKTIVYYTRSQAAREATQFTVSKEIEDQVKEQQEGISCSLENPEECEMCSS